MNDGRFSWSAFSPLRWDHYYANGQQIRFYRLSPELISGCAFWGHVPIRKRRPKLFDRIVNLFRR
jgi:hypothetical protein